MSVSYIINSVGIIALLIKPRDLRHCLFEEGGKERRQEIFGFGREKSRKIQVLYPSVEGDPTL